MVKKRPSVPAPAPASFRRNSRPAYSLEINRLKREYTALGYQSVSSAIRDGRVVGGGSGDAHLLYTREQLVNQARQFDRNNGIFAGMVDRACSYVVGSGFELQVRTSDEAWNVEAEALFREWWEDPEITGLNDGHGIESLLASELMTVGDVGVILTDQGKIQLVESEQIRGRTPKLADGIERDPFGRPVRYWVAPWSGVSGVPDASKAVSYGPEEFLFLARRRRPSQTRGVPPLQASFAQLHRINDVCDSEAVAWALLSRLAVSVTRSGAAALAYSESQADPSAEGDEGRIAQRITELDHALIFHAEPGEEVKGIERNIPGRDFSASLTMFLRLLGLPLGLPLEIILLDWTKSNYSQSRAVLMQAFASFLRWQRLLERFFHRRLYRWWVDLQVAAGNLAPVPDRYKHEWIKPSFPWIDALSEAEAYGKKLDRGFATLTEVHKSLNRDRQETLDLREREVREAIARAQRIEEETGTPVPWEIFAGLEHSVNAAATAKKEDVEDES